MDYLFAFWVGKAEPGVDTVFGGGVVPGSWEAWAAAGVGDRGAAVDSAAVAGSEDLAVDRLVAAEQAEAGRAERRPWKNCWRS